MASIKDPSVVDLREKLFYHIRYHDVELAEGIIVRCPTITNIKELNDFFRVLLSQYEVDTFTLRTVLDDTMDINRWFYYFDTEILPVLRVNRLPPLTHKSPTCPSVTH